MTADVINIDWSYRVFTGNWDAAVNGAHVAALVNNSGAFVLRWKDRVTGEPLDSTTSEDARKEAERIIRERFVAAADGRLKEEGEWT